MITALGGEKRYERKRGKGGNRLNKIIHELITVIARDGTDGFKILFYLCVCLHILILKKLKFYNSLRGILSWCIYISNHHTVYFEYLILFVNYTSIKLGARGKFIKRERERKNGREGGRKKERKEGRLFLLPPPPLHWWGLPMTNLSLIWFRWSCLYPDMCCWHFYNIKQWLFKISLLGVVVGVNNWL